MYPHRFPPVYLAQVIGTILCIALVIIFTGNALALIALALIPSFPLVPEHPEDEEPEDDDYQGTSAGFTPD